MILFTHHQAKSTTHNLLCCEDHASIELFDMQSHAKIFSSKKPIIERITKINHCLKTVIEGEETKLWSSPEIILSTDRGLHFMNVRVSKLVPKMNSIYLKED